MKLASGTPTGSRSGQRDGRLERGDRVVAEGADRAAGEARHPLDGHDAAPRDEGAQRGERVRGLRGDDREVGRVVGDADRAGGRAGDAVRDLEQPPRADAQEAVAAEALAALDGLEQVGGRGPVVEAQERADRRLEVRRARRAQEDRVGGAGEALRLGQAQRVGHGGGPSAARRLGCRRRPRIRNDQVRLFRDERSLVLPRCHPRSAVCRTRDRRIRPRRSPPGAIDRRCPVSLALCAGAYWSSAPSRSAVASSSVAPRSVRGLPGPFAAAAIPARTSRRVSVMAPDGYSSRSRPVFSCGGSLGAPLRGVKGSATPGRRPATGA